jgi:hypothetical protein
MKIHKTKYVSSTSTIFTVYIYIYILSDLKMILTVVVKKGEKANVCQQCMLLMLICMSNYNGFFK